jgi:DNA-binding NtrC family response regulator
VQVSALSRERLILQLFGNPGQVEEPGRIAMADEGTLYLENADMLPPGVQASLASGAREGVFPVPGGRGLIRSEPLVVVSLSESPDALLDKQLLSEDFLACFPHQVTIPPLRARKQDLVELTERFVDEICREYAREALNIAPDAFETLVNYDWPGNVRELQRTVERLVLLAPGSTIRRADLPPHLLGGSKDEDKGIEDTLARFERRWLAQNLREVDGDVQRASERLGLSLDEFKARLARFGLDPEAPGE